MIHSLARFVETYLTTSTTIQIHHEMRTAFLKRKLSPASPDMIFPHTQRRSPKKELFETWSE